MTMLLAIPSKGRPEGLKKCILPWLTLSRVRCYTVVFIEPQEEEAYREVLRGTSILIHVIPKKDQGLGYVKAEIGKYAVDNGYEYIFKMDDDIKSWDRQRVSRSFQGSADHFAQAVTDCLEMMEEREEVAAIGFPYRNEMFKLQKWLSINTRLQTCYLIRTSDWHADPRISTFEDFTQYLKIRLANRLTLRYGLTGMDYVPVGKQDGGLQLFDRDEMAKKEIEIIRNEIYPALEVRKVEGKSWSIEPHLRGAVFGAKRLV